MPYSFVGIPTRKPRKPLRGSFRGLPKPSSMTRRAIRRVNARTSVFGTALFRAMPWEALVTVHLARRSLHPEVREEDGRKVCRIDICNPRIQFSKTRTHVLCGYRFTQHSGLLQHTVWLGESSVCGGRPTSGGMRAFGLDSP